MPGLGTNWQLTFHVGGSSTFQARYDEVLAAHPVPGTVTADTAAAHDMAVSLISTHSIVPPMDVMLSGGWDSDNLQSIIQVQVSQSS